MPALLVAVLGLTLVLWLLAQPYLRARKHQRLRQQPFPEGWHQTIQQRLPYVCSMPVDLQTRLRQHVLVFLAEKTFIGCDGLQINDEMRVMIATQACLLILARPRGYYPKLHEILIYPGSFVVRHENTDEIGVSHQTRQALSGESGEHGQVVLSWQDILEDAATPDDGQNLVIHEFAHQLDQETGFANGAPRLPQQSQYARWSRVLGTEFRRLRQASAERQATLFDDYGASDPAEFFAVISEVFFEQPQRMAEEHSSLYQELSSYYGLDPLSWQGTALVDSHP